jgi:Tfp pilus assembly protein PilF
MGPGSGLAFSATSRSPGGFILGDEGGFPMRVRIWIIGLLLIAFAGPAYADRRSDAKDQVEFGIAVAQRGLWKEATYRWEKAVEIDPGYAEAWNDLGIGYEQLGQFDQARKAYEKALEVDPDNTYIRNNYDLFREIYDRQNRRRDR